MRLERKIASVYTLLLGLFLLAGGIWGCFSLPVFSVLTTNRLHSSIHITLGIMGIWLGVTKKPTVFCIVTGSFLSIVGTLRFIKGPDQFVIDLLRVNYVVASIFIVIGVLSLIMAITTRKGRASAIKMKPARG